MKITGAASGAFSRSVIDAKIQQIRALAENKKPVDVLFAGSSIALLGMNPSTFERNDPERKRAYNSAIPSGFPQVQLEWLMHDVLPQLEPKLVVYGVSFADLYDKGGGVALVTYRALRQAQSEPNRDSEGPASANSAGAGVPPHRSASRSLHRELATGFIRRARRDPVTPLGYVPVIPDVSARSAKAYHKIAIAHYSIGEEEADALKQVLATLRTLAIPVVMVHMPMHRSLAALHPGGPQGHFEAQNRVNSIAREEHIPCIDMTDGFEDEALFFDLAHLAPRGADRLTKRLAATLAASSYLAPEPVVVESDRPHRE